MYFSQNPGVVDYLIQKLEERTKLLPKSKIALSNIITINDLNNNKRDMIKFFTELEDDLTQGTQAIKTMFALNKDLAEQIENSEIRKKRLELKTNVTEKANSELNYKINELLNENLNLKEKISNIKVENTEKINYLESHLEHKKTQLEKLDLVNYELEKKIDALNEELEDYRNTQNQISPKFNKFSPKFEEIKSLKTSFRSQTSPKDESKRVISERDYVKKQLNNQIQEHFQNSKESSERGDSNYGGGK